MPQLYWNWHKQQSKNSSILALLLFISQKISSVLFDLEHQQESLSLNSKSDELIKAPSSPSKKRNKHWNGKKIEEFLFIWELKAICHQKKKINKKQLNPKLFELLVVKNVEKLFCIKMRDVSIILEMFIAFFFAVL